MSQWLYVGQTADPFYECVIRNRDGVAEKLAHQWLSMQRGHCTGPWKIQIADQSLYRDIEPIIDSLFTQLGHRYPDEIWAFYDGRTLLQHPTREELTAWLAERT